MAVPTKDSLLATYAPNFAAIVTLSPTTYNITPAQATALTARRSVGFDPLVPLSITMRGKGEV